MQFYSTAHFYPDGKIVWMTEGTRYQSTIAKWANLINAPTEHKDDVDVYAKPGKDHNSMHICTRKFLIRLWRLINLDPSTIFSLTYPLSTPF